MEFLESIANKVKQFHKANANVDGKVNGMKFKKFLNQNPDIEQYYQQLLKQEPRFVVYGNITWCIINNFDIDQYKCVACGKQLKMQHCTQLLTYCSAKCATNDQQYKSKKKQTILADQSFYERRQQKIRQTNLLRYGTVAPAQNEQIKNKMKQTRDSDPLIWQKRQQKTIQTNLKKYGYECNDV